MGKAIIIKDADFSQVAVSSNAIPLTGLAISGGTGSQTQRQVQLSVEYTPANTTQKGVQWVVVSGSATISSSGLLTYNGSAANANVTVRATSTRNNSIYAQKTISFAMPTVEAPTFSPAQGTYNAVQQVELACATAGATIHYTTNGSTPTSSSPTYSQPISVNEDMTIKAIAVKNGDTSPVASASYVIEIPHTVTVSVSDGTLAITGATVKLTKNDVDTFPSSSSGGSYVFNVPDGTYTLKVEKQGYEAHTELVTVNGNDVTVVVVVVVERPLDILQDGAFISPNLHLYGTAGKTNPQYQAANGCSLITYENSNRSCILALRSGTTHPCTWNSASTASAEDQELYSLYEINQNYPYIEISINSPYSFVAKLSDSDPDNSYWYDPMNSSWGTQASLVLTPQQNPVYLTLQLRTGSNASFGSNPPTIEQMGLTIKAYKENPNQD